MGYVLREASAAEFSVLKEITRPCVSKKRVTTVCGSVSGGPWDRFFGSGPSLDSTDVPAKAAGSRPTTNAAKKAIPLRDAGHLLRDGMALRAAKLAQEPQKPQNRKAGKAKKKQSFDPWLETTVKCRECLRSYKRLELPNPRRRVCEACGGQPESTSIRTVSGGSPGLGRRR